MRMSTAQADGRSPYVVFATDSRTDSKVPVAGKHKPVPRRTLLSSSRLKGLPKQLFKPTNVPKAAPDVEPSPLCTGNASLCTTAALKVCKLSDAPMAANQARKTAI